MFWVFALLGLCVDAQTTTAGDINGDGAVDVADVNAVINAMLGKTQPVEVNERADVTGDGAVDVTDVNLVINFMLGKEQPQDVFARLEAAMVTVEGGTFDMGTPAGVSPYAHAWERPVHAVILPSFKVCKYEVTQDLWQAVMDGNPSAFSGEHRPVESVSWNDCKAFVAKLNQITGKNYRLLTEAEWEYCARGGAKSCHTALYAGQDELDKVAWHAGNAAGETHEVGRLAPNELGLYDMSGNVLEWVEDTHADVYAAWPAANRFVVAGRDPVVRGGSWRWGANYCRVSWRGYFPAETANNYLGLRLACDMNP